MNNRNSFIAFLAVAFLVSFSALHAQVSLGLKSGAHFNTVRSDESLETVFPKLDYTSGAQFGAVAEFPIWGALSAQAEFNYLRKGFVYQLNQDVNLFDVPVPVGVNADFRIQHFELPVLLKYTFGEGPLRAYVTGGPSVSYANDGEIITRTTGVIELRVATVPLNLDRINYERFDVGLQGGAGFSIHTPLGKIFADGRYHHGFNQVYDIPVVESTIKNQGYSINAGVLVPISRK